MVLLNAWEVEYLTFIDFKCSVEPSDINFCRRHISLSMTNQIASKLEILKTDMMMMLYHKIKIVVSFMEQGNEPARETVLQVEALQCGLANIFV